MYRDISKDVLRNQIELAIFVIVSGKTADHSVCSRCDSAEQEMNILFHQIRHDTFCGEPTRIAFGIPNTNR